MSFVRITGILRLLALASAPATLVACGQSGPLYLPGNPSEIQAPLPEPAEVPAEEEDDDPAEGRR